MLKINSDCTRLRNEQSQKLLANKLSKEASLGQCDDTHTCERKCECSLTKRLTEIAFNPSNRRETTSCHEHLQNRSRSSIICKIKNKHKPHSIIHSADSGCILIEDSVSSSNQSPKTYVPPRTTKLFVTVVLFLILFVPSIIEATRPLKSSANIFANIRRPRTSIGRAIHSDRNLKPQFTGTNVEHDSFIIEPYVSSGKPSPYAPLTSTQYETYRRPTRVNRFQHADHSSKPSWSSSGHYSGYGHKSQRPSSQSHNSYRNDDLPPQLAALSDEELDSFFEALYRNRTRYARRPDEDFGEGSMYRSL